MSALAVKTELLKYTDPTNADFQGWPPDSATTASNWGKIVRPLFASLVVPPVTPVIVDAAIASFESTFLAALNTTSSTRAVTGLNSGLDVLAASIAAGVLQSGSAVACLPPPPGTLLIELTMTGTTSDASEAADRFSVRLATWVATGTATITPPTVQNWT